MLKIHHIGCLVDEIETSKDAYRKLFGIDPIPETFFITSQKVFVSFIDIGKDMYLELIQPTEDNTTLSRLRKNNTSYYHIGYTVNNLKKSIDNFLALNSLLVNTFRSEAFEGRECAFLYTPEMHLIELIENGLKNKV